MKTEALTESVVTEWQEKGAVKIPQLLDPAELSACREFYDWILANPSPIATQFFEGEEDSFFNDVGRRLVITPALNLYLKHVLASARPSSRSLEPITKISGSLDTKFFTNWEARDGIRHSIRMPLLRPSTASIWSGYGYRSNPRRSRIALK